MKKIRTLIADDTVVYRSQIRAALEGLPQIEVVGVAANGKLAIEKMQQSSVDLLILDLEMPELDGVETLKLKQKLNLPGKVLVFSSLSKSGAEASLEALQLGASDFIPKPGTETVGSESPHERIKKILVPRIEAIFFEYFKDNTDVPIVLKNENYKSFPPPRIVVIGSSTGGPTVLEKIFSKISGNFNCPVVIVQHMPPIFTTQLAERLGRITQMPAFEITDQMKMQKGAIYVAPGNFHARIKKRGEEFIFTIDQGPLINSIRPAVDPLFESAASIFGAGVLGFVLTGMGADGKVGAEKIKAEGGSVVIQSAESCVVFGMPGAVYAAGAYDVIATPDEIVQIICDTTFCRKNEKVA